MKVSPRALFASLAILLTVASATDLNAARGRAVINSAGTTFVTDNGRLLRGPRHSTELGNLPARSVLQGIRNYGCNSLHVYAERSDYGYEAGARAATLDTLVQWTRDDGLYLIITIGNGGGANETFPQEFWNFYAGRYANETHVLYEIKNEPTFWQPSSAAVITMEKSCYNIIRSKAPNTPVLLMSYVGLKSGAGVLTDIAALGTTVNWNNAAIAFHGYAEAGRNQNLAALQVILDAGYPCIQTEYYVWPYGTGNYNLGQGSSLYQDTTQTGDYERLGVSWLTFLDITQIADDTRFKSRLQNAGIVWTPDFGSWPVGSRSSYGNSGQPWAIMDTTTTLKIQAENYDTGGENIAYHDNNTANQGGAYRTSEGVDVQTTSDSGGGHNLSYMESGEWVEYTAYIDDAGRYELRLRVAGGAASVRVRLGGIDLTGAWATPATGGFQTWQTIIKTVNLTPGQQVLRVEVLATGVNLNWIEIAPVTTGAIANGTYKLINRNSAKAMDVVGASTANGAKIQQWGYSATNNQKWVFTHKGANQYTITSANGGKSIDLASYNCLAGDYLSMYSLWNGTGSPNQRFILTATDSGYYRITNAYSGLEFNVIGSSTANGAVVEQRDTTENSAQWHIGAP